MGTGRQARTVTSELSQAARIPAVLRVVFDRRRSALAARSNRARDRQPTLRAMQAIRASVDDGEPIHVILDNLNHHKNRDVRDWCDANTRRARVHADVRVVGEPDRGALRAAPPVRHREQRPPRPSGARPSDPQVRPLAQHPHPRPARPRSRTPPPSPHPQRTTTTMGPAHAPPPHSARTFVVRALAAHLLEVALHRAWRRAVSRSPGACRSAPCPVRSRSRPCSGRP